MAASSTITRRPTTAGRAGIPWGEILPRSPLTGDTRQSPSDFALRAGAPTCASTFSPTAAWPDSGCMAMWRPIRALVRGGQRNRSGGDGARRVCGGVQRHVLRPPPEPHQPGRSTNMGDGWETRRRRGPGHDWTIVRLARRGVLATRRAGHRPLQGQRAGRCAMSWCDAPNASADALAASAVVSGASFCREPTSGRTAHRFERGGPPAERATHVRLDIYPRWWRGPSARVRSPQRRTP